MSGHTQEAPPIPAPPDDDDNEAIELAKKAFIHTCIMIGLFVAAVLLFIF